MPPCLTVVGLDITLTNMGWSRFIYRPDRLELLDLGLCQTHKASAALRKAVSASEDYLARARLMRSHLMGVIAGADIVISEMPTIASQSSAAVWSFGITFGLLAGIEVPLIPVTPLQAKKAALQPKGAGKAEMIRWAHDLYPSANWLRAHGRSAGHLVAANEHIADSIAVAHAGITSETGLQTLSRESALREKNSINAEKR